MCGRFSQNFGRHQHAIFPFKSVAKGALVRPPRYNIAPTQYVPVITQEIGAEPEIQELYWGLIPNWSRNMTMAARCINARCETVAEKQPFREAYRKRRCLVPASGFYEWKKGSDRKTRTPYYFTAAAEDALLVFAGLWERWDRAGEEIRSFSILTSPANTFMQPFHDRMPVILARDCWSAWLDPLNQDFAHLESLLHPPPDDILQSWRVGPEVNNPRNENEDCIRRVG